LLFVSNCTPSNNLQQFKSCCFSVAACMQKKKRYMQRAFAWCVWAAACMQWEKWYMHRVIAWCV